MRVQPNGSIAVRNFETRTSLSLEYQQASSLKRFLHLILCVSRLGSALQRSAPRLVSGLDMNARGVRTEYGTGRMRDGGVDGGSEVWAWSQRWERRRGSGRSEAVEDTIHEAGFQIRKATRRRSGAGVLFAVGERPGDEVMQGRKGIGTVTALVSVQRRIHTDAGVRQNGDQSLEQRFLAEMLYSERRGGSARAGGRADARRRRGADEDKEEEEYSRGRPNQDRVRSRGTSCAWHHYSD